MMKTLIATIALGAALIPAAASAQAQANDIAVGGFPIQNLTRQQAQQIADGTFERLDVDHNGTVTRQEAEQVREQMGVGVVRAQKMIDR